MSRGNEGRRGRARRTYALAAGALLAAVVLSATASLSGARSDSGKPPRIVTATATYHETTGKVGFSVEVQRRARKVTVFHGGTRLPAHHIKQLKYWWDTGQTQARKRRCYPIRVKARNGHGLSTRRLRAGRLGTKGC